MMTALTTSFDASVDAFVTEALAHTDTRSFAELLHLLPGVTPPDATASLRRIRDRWPVAAAVLDDAFRISSRAQPIFCAPTETLPIAHPLDYDWRFDEVTADWLLQRCREFSDPNHAIAMIGTPTLALAASRMKIPQPLLFLDSNESIIQHVKSASSAICATCIDVERDELPEYSAPVVVIDSPWYERPAAAFLWAAARLCANGGRVLACFPGLGTRPEIAKERQRLIAGAANAGLTHVDTRSAVISYETPPFERSALAVAGITNVPSRWRRGDLLTFVRTAGYSIARPSAPNHEERWIEVDIHGVPLKVRPPTSFEFAKPNIESVISGDVLPSVSRRDPRRARADIWTPTNRIFGCRGRAVLLQILRAVASRKASESLVAEMLGRSLLQDEITKIEDATRQVRALVRQERASLQALGALA